MKARFSCLAAFFLATNLPPALAALPPVSANGFGIVAIIPLPGVTGRIDHLAYDRVAQIVFVAELANNTVSAVNVTTRRVERRLTGFGEPQGVAFSPALGRLYVASGDGKLRSFHSEDLSPDKSVHIGADADNVRIDEKMKRIYVGYGKGAIAVLDAVTLVRAADLPLSGHPEGFQLAPDDSRLFVNVPDANEITVLDRARTKPVAHWQNGTLKANYPMAIDRANGRLVSVFRQPARIVSRDIALGSIVADVPTCADADDVFVDARRRQLYVVCGEGMIDVLSSPALQKVTRLPTVAGARTGLFDADANRLFVAARANGGAVAALWVLAPAP